eukprot:CAMPEP_0184486284 /NCGR_PEP_ID=MMETSP0113_2-20130426/7798_1 /TAXON_ID=91329 /ORGANISM="Norrisiella sphaerica, Strain BC52" /LENGTH=276 /DNA_ID=CAMNT_0026868083 /DNA_START=410 /DNA_END=1240 /DNA_ORIENTATION=-
MTKRKDPSWRDGLAAWSAGIRESSSTFWNTTSYAFGAFQKDSGSWMSERRDEWGAKFNNFTQTLLDNAAIAAANDFAQNWGQSIANSAAISAVREFMDSKPAKFAAAGGAALGGIWVWRKIFQTPPESYMQGMGPDVDASFLAEKATHAAIDWKQRFFALKQEIQQLKWELATERRLAFEYDQLRLRAENDLSTTEARLDELRNLLERLLRGDKNIFGNAALGGGGGDGNAANGNLNGFEGSADGHGANGAFHAAKDDDDDKDDKEEKEKNKRKYK